MGALTLARRRDARRPPRAPARRRRRGSASAACGCALFDRDGARDALERARALGPPPSRACSTSRSSRTCSGDLGGELSACEQATLIAPESAAAWARYAHALARTDRFSDASPPASARSSWPTTTRSRDLRDRVRAAAPRELGSAA